MTTTSLTSHTDAVAQGSYLYRVRARDAAGNVSASSASSATVVVDTTAPGVAGRPSGAPNPTVNAATTSWAAASDTGGAGIAGYVLERNSDGAGFAEIARPQGTSWLDGAPEGVHVYRVRAFDAAGNAGNWSESSAPVRVDKTPPTSPGAPTASPNPTNDAATLSWAASSDPGGSGVASYAIERSADSGASWTTLATTAAPSFIDEPPEGSFQYRVRARDAAGNTSAWAVATDALLVDLTAPSVPGQPAASPNPSNGALTVSWPASSDAGGAGLSKYELSVSTDGGASWSPLASTGAPTHTFTPAEGSYRFRVRAIDGAGNGSPHSQESDAAIVDLTAPAAPGTPSATPNPGSGAHTVSWAAATDAGGSGVAAYELYRRDEGSTAWTLVTTQPGLSYAAQLPTGNFHYRVRALDAAGNEGAHSAESDAVRIDTVASVLTFVSAPQSVTAGEASAALSVQRRNSLGVPMAPASALTLEVTTDSSTGGFAASPAGPFTPGPYARTI
ncbi:MAG: hypothetical protein ACK4N5_18030, partial [Myxococcales bacterium]